LLAAGAEPPAATELIGLVARGEVAQVEARICALSLVEFMAVMRSVQKLEER
jgi:hypothetical protein